MSAAALIFVRTFSPRQPGGMSRLAALIFFLMSLLGAGVVMTQPQAAQLAGMALLVAIGIGAIMILAVALPRQGARADDARRAAAAAAASNMAFAVTSKDGSVLECNVAYRFLAGAGEGEPPAPPQLAFPGQGPAAALYRLSRAAAEGRAREEMFETEQGQRLAAAVRPLKDGEAAWWLTPRLPDAAPLKGTVTEKRVPSALIRFSDFFRNAPMAVAIAAPDGRVVEANTVFADFFAQGEHGAGASFVDLVKENERAAVLDLIARSAAGESPPAPVEVHAAGGKRPGESSAQLFASPFMPSPDGELRAILYIVDTSELTALGAQFAQSQKMQAIGQLAGGVAHDFNNLLQAIIGNCDLLLMRHPAGDPSFAEINEVRQNSARAAGLVRQLLAFSRQQTLQPKVLALGDTITELSMMLRRLLGEKIVLRLEHAQDLWRVRVDEGQISNALVNLVVNARDAIPPEGGTVTVRTSNLPLATPKPIGSGQIPAGDYVLIEVADTGKGIPRESFVKIFEPFYTTKPVGHGTGLGLSTVYGIVKQTGGFIDLSSDMGKGTVFLIYLPRHAAAEVAEVHDEPERVAHRDVTGQDTILLVEDEDAVRSFAARALRMRGYTVLEASGGEAALEIVRNHSGSIDLVISDVVMPGMEGPDLVRAALRIRPEMRVIFMSGYAEEAFRRGGEKAEELHFLPKPFGLKQLVAKVKEVLSGAAPASSANLSDTGT